MNRTKVSIVLGIVCLLLTLAIVVQIRTISSSISVSDPTYVDDGLRDEVLKLKEKYEDKYKELENAELEFRNGMTSSLSELELEKKRAEATENDEASIEKENELKVGEAILGTSEVSGKGVVITVNDNQTISTESLGASEDASMYIVHYDDLLNIVNELKNAGAEAISINGQRVIVTTPIICGGNIININGERIGSPFEIKAIGSPEALANL